MKALNVILIGILLGVAGCSSSKPAKDGDTYYLAVFEDFDADEYPEVVPPLSSSEVQHEIPPGLEASEEPMRRSRGRGYRVQVFASRDKKQADEEVERAILWWEGNRPGGAMDHPPVYVVYEQPFYKVRLGNYQSRSAAARDKEALSRAFQGAFVVPATIELR